MDNLYVIKIGGNIIDDEQRLSDFLSQFSSLRGRKILVHGGGKLASRLAEQLNIPQQLVEGRRITDSETLKIVTMVYAGYINKNIVAQLQQRDCNALGLTGADANVVLAHKRFPGAGANSAVDYGFAGDVDEVNTKLIKILLEQDITPVIAPITHDKQGQLLNTNADTIAQEIAKAMAGIYDVFLVYGFEKPGVLSNAEDDSSVINDIDQSSYNLLKEKKIVFSGMIPKLDNAFSALNSGVKKVIIGRAEEIQHLITGEKGTTIVIR